MFRHPWELDRYARYQIALLADERRRSRGSINTAGWPAFPASMRRSLGFGLIRLGERLAGRAVPGEGGYAVTTAARPTV